jgi:hypothetical protein
LALSKTGTELSIEFKASPWFPWADFIPAQISTHGLKIAQLGYQISIVRLMVSEGTPSLDETKCFLYENLKKVEK